MNKISELIMLKIALKASLERISIIDPLNANKSFLLEYEFDKTYITQNYYSFLNLKMALENDNRLEVFLIQAVNFFSALPNCEIYTCFSHALTIKLLKMLEKDHCITQLTYQKAFKSVLEAEYRNFGTKETSKNIQLYKITFRKIWSPIPEEIIDIFKSLDLNSESLAFYYNEYGDLQIMIPEKRTELKVYLEYIKLILINMKMNAEDIHTSTKHYYRLLKKCQILTK